MNHIELIGKRFGKLLVIKKAESIFTGKRFHGAWVTLCDCGNEKIVKTIYLTMGSTTTCGCSKLESKNGFKPGDQFGRLTLVKYLINKWECRCSCGNTKIVKTENLNNDNTRSCGCLKTDVGKQRADKLRELSRIHTPHIASAKRRYQSYNTDPGFTLTFDEYYKISQMNCTYCGVEPSNKYNYFSNSSNEYSRVNGTFINNGIDRIDTSNNNQHTIDNVCSACYDCNRSKSNMSKINFLNWVSKLQEQDEKELIILNYPTNNHLKNSINSVYYNYKYQSKLTKEEFYSMSQMNCHYCNSKPSNNFNYSRGCKKSSEQAKEQGDFIYNGLDRKDSSIIAHDIDLCVPCCRICNWAKSKLTMKEFYNWINRIQSYQKLKG